MFVTFLCAVCSQWGLCVLHAKEKAAQIAGSVAVETTIFNDENNNNDNPCAHKSKYLQILLRAGLPTENITASLCRQLPTEDQVAQLYGSEPIIHGLEQCARYREGLVLPKTTMRTRTIRSTDPDTSTASTTAPSLTPQIRVTGLFNTGTNAFQMALHVNLEQNGNSQEGKEETTAITATHTETFEVPWKKHFPAVARRDWATSSSSSLHAENLQKILTIVLIRDPYRWMQSMVRGVHP